ncbi:MAG: DUF885 domain-containing protein [Pseudomonadota bacterium]
MTAAGAVTDRLTRSLRVAVLAGLSLAVLSCGGGGGGSAPAAPPTSTPPPSPSPSASETARTALTGLALDEFFDASYKTLLARSPESVVSQALEAEIPLATVDLDSWSDAYRRETLAVADVILELLLTYDRAALDAPTQRDYDVYRWYLEDRVAELDFFYNAFVATYSVIGVQNQTERFFSDLHPLATRDDAEAYIQRLGHVARKFNEIADHVLRQRDVGIVEPALSLQVAIDRVRPLATGSPDSHPYYRVARDRLAADSTLSLAERNELLALVLNAVTVSVIPGYQRLLVTLESLQPQAPQSIGVGQYPNGAAYYENRLRHHTSSDLNAAEIHQLGLDELVRIRAEMRALFDQLGYPQNETLQQLYARVAIDGGTVAAGNVLATYEAIVADAEQRFPAAFDIAPMASVVVLPDEFGGFYIGPSFDGARPGAFYAGTSRDEPRYLMPSLSYHEAVPGHHTQIALAMEQDVPLFRKIVRTTGFVEGWALYAERLASELGWYDGDVYGELGRLQYEALRAARLVMDTGIHFYGWSFEQAVQFNIDNTGFSRSSSEGAAARYSVWPGQATGYMVGLVEILRLRQKAIDELGTDFDLVAFHRLLLGNGAVPLTQLEASIDAWIAERSTQ